MNKKNIITLFLPLSVFFLLFLGFFHPTNDLSVDLGESLLTGKIIVATHAFITTNLFSYTFPHFYYINNQWLSMVIFYLIDKAFGLNGLILLTICVCASAFALVYFYAYNRGNKMLISFGALLYLFVLFFRTDVRPEIFSYLFLAVTVSVLYRFRQKYTHWIFILIPLQILWVNMHIYFIIGLYATGLFLVDGLITGRGENRGKYNRTLFIVFTASLMACLINPFGLNGMLFPFTVFQNYGFSVKENANIFLAMSSIAFFYPYFLFWVIAVMQLVLLACLARKADLINWLICISFIAAGILIVRNIPLFVFATFIPFSFLLSAIADGSFEMELIDSIKPKLPLLLFCLYVVAGLWTAYQVYSPDEFGLGSGRRGQEAVNFLITNRIKGPVFNDYDSGSYLAYRLYPQERVFVDSRPEAYPASFFQDTYMPMLRNKTLFNKEAARYHFNIIFFSITDMSPNAAGFIKSMLSGRSWKPVYLDQYAVIFLRNSIQNKLLIERLNITQNRYKIPAQLSDSDRNNLGIFLYQIGWKQKAFETFEAGYALNNANCADLHNILVLTGFGQGKSSVVQTDSATTYYVKQYQKNCQE